MPCSCHYDPPEASKRLIKSLCEQIVYEIKRCERIGDPVGISIHDTKILLDHLYDPSSCEEFMATKNNCRDHIDNLEK